MQVRLVRLQKKQIYTNLIDIIYLKKVSKIVTLTKNHTTHPAVDGAKFFPFLAHLGAWAYFHLANKPKKNIRWKKKYKTSGIFIYLWALSQKTDVKRGAGGARYVNALYKFYLQAVKYIYKFA